MYCVGWAEGGIKICLITSEVFLFYGIVKVGAFF